MMLRRVLPAFAVVLLASFLPTGVAAAAPGRYVALGDSAASGPLIPNPDLSFPGCIRSTNNYPKLVARQLGLQITDVTCSGADTVDMTNPQETDLGTAPPQFDALTPDTSVVTLQIGGNDAGLTGLAQSCLNIWPQPFGDSCADENTAGGHDVYGERVAAVGPRVAAVLDGIHAKSPSARVLVVGYTYYIRAGGCYPRVQLWGKRRDLHPGEGRPAQPGPGGHRRRARRVLCGHPDTGRRPRRVHVGLGALGGTVHPGERGRPAAPQRPRHAGHGRGGRRIGLSRLSPRSASAAAHRSARRRRRGSPLGSDPRQRSRTPEFDGSFPRNGFPGAAVRKVRGGGVPWRRTKGKRPNSCAGTPA